MNKKDNGKIKKLTAIITSGVVCAAIVTTLIISGNNKSESKGSDSRERHELTTVTTRILSNDDTGTTAGDTTGDTTESKDDKTTQKPSTEKTTKTTTESTTEKTTRSTTRSTTESTTETTTRSTTRESTTERTSEVTTRSTTEYTTEYTTEATTRATTRETTTESTTEATTRATTRETTTESTTEDTTEAPHKHTWVWKTHTEIIHHDAVTHEEPVYDEGWTEYIYETKYHCGECGTFYDTRQLLRDHQNESGHGSWGTQKVLVDTIEHEPEILYYDTIIDIPAWDEYIEVKDYQYCSECGAKK